MGEMKKAGVRVFRFNPVVDKEPRYESYEVPLEWGMTVMNALEYINENFDGGLAFYSSCGKALCGGCTAMVNGKAGMICQMWATEDMTIEPLKGRKVIKDLVVE